MHELADLPPRACDTPSRVFGRENLGTPRATPRIRADQLYEEGIAASCLRGEPQRFIVPTSTCGFNRLVQAPADFSQVDFPELIPARSSDEREGMVITQQVAHRTGQPTHRDGNLAIFSEQMLDHRTQTRELISGTPVHLIDGDEQSGPPSLEHIQEVS